MLELDMTTAVFSYILLSYLCTILLVHTWLRNSKHFVGTGLFATGLALQSFGMTLALFRGSLTPVLTVVLANTIMLSGLVVLLAGLADFIGHRINVKKYIAYVLVFTALYFFYAIITPNIRMRIMLFSLATIPIFLHNCIAIFFSADKNHKQYASQVGVVYIFLIIISLLRSYYAFDSHEIAKYFGTQITDTLLVIVSMLLTTAITYAFQNMINNKLSHEAEIHVEEHKKTLAELDRLATYDSLTNIFNRRKLELTLSQHIAYSKRYNHPVSILLCDIDNFKRINDKYGHYAGDKALVAVIQALTKNMRSVDIIGRWGGEEFLVIAPGLAFDKAMLAADRLRMEVMSHQRSALWDNETLTISVGVAEYNAIETQENLIIRADKALYRAKELGRNRVEGNTM